MECRPPQRHPLQFLRSRQLPRLSHPDECAAGQVVIHMHQQVVACNSATTSIVSAVSARPTADVRGCKIGCADSADVEPMSLAAVQHGIVSPIASPRCVKSLDRCPRMVAQVVTPGVTRWMLLVALQPQCSLGTSRPAPADPRRPRQLAYMSRTPSCGERVPPEMFRSTKPH